MIYYRPTDGDPQQTPLRTRPRTCFLMTQLGGSTPRVVSNIRTTLTTLLRADRFNVVDADSLTTGKDFLLKIWEMIASVPVGVAIVHDGMSLSTIANVFYEFGLMQAYGKETLIVKTKNASIPSDFVRTEYVEYGPQFKRRIKQFLGSLEDRAEYYSLIADQVEKNPLLAIDYLRRAYLLTEDRLLADRAKEIFSNAGITERAKNSVESLLLSFD